MLTDETHIKTFCAQVQKIMPEGYSITHSVGQKFYKIIQLSRGGGRSVWGFVDKSNGDLLKAEGWSKPAKHARGNIHSPDVSKAYVWTGPNYMRG